MADFTKVVLTTKLDQMLKASNVPTVQFDTTSTTYVDVTGVAITTPNGFTAGVNFSMKGTGGITIDAILTVGSSSSTNVGTNNTSFTRFTTAVIKNIDGSSVTAKLQLKTDNGANPASIQATTTVIASAPFTNQNDRFFRASVTEIKILGCLSVSEGIEGKLSDQTDKDVVTVIINAIMDRFIFSANSGKVLWDWNGSTIELA